MGSPYFTDQRGGGAHGAHPAQDSWPPVRGQVATGAQSSMRAPAPPVPPPGEFDLMSGPPSTPGAIRRVEMVAAGEQEYWASPDQRHFQPGYDADYGYDADFGYDADPGYDGYQDHHRPTGGSPRFGDPAYSAYDDYSVQEDQLASRSWTATSAARGVGGSGRAAAAERASATATDTRFGPARSGSGTRSAPSGRARADRAERPEGAARTPGAHRAPAGRPGSARARLAIASTASLAGLSALVGTAVMATDTGPLTIKPGPGGTATGQWPSSESTNVAAAGGGTMDDGPHLTPVAPGGTTSSRHTPAPTPVETEPPATLADLTGGMIYGDGGYVNAAGPLSPSTSSTDPAAAAAVPDDATAAAAAAPSSSTPGQTTMGTTSGTLSDWLGIGDLGLGDILGTGTPSTPSSPGQSTSPDDPTTSPDPTGSASPSSSSSPSGSATTPAGQSSATSTSTSTSAGSSSSSTPHASAAPSPSAAPTSATTSARYTADPFVVTSADPASNRAVVGRFV